MAAEFEERARIPCVMDVGSGVEMGAGRCTVFWHRLDECGTGSDAVEGQD